MTGTVTMGSLASAAISGIGADHDPVDRDLVLDTLAHGETRGDDR